MNYPITAIGHNKLLDELTRLKSERKNIAERIEEARQQGDISENAEYHAAKEEQGLHEARIAVIEDKLSRAFIVDTSKLNKNMVQFGSTVHLVNVDTDEELRYQIVSDEEVDVSEGFISNQSPIARELIRKEVGDTITVSAPGGDKEFEILNIT